ncbi:hypothetical protein [Acidobacterium sp. S8]|uniref:hypothetical protein n=1 Tax=Acidobacterium sp. S8 TaxID=1641854 RepID=UPI00131C746C|nr:hypothetical protein [Acidobacterium sp. S8]
MKRVALLVVLLQAVFASSLAAGQQAPQDAPHAPDGGTFERINNIDIPPVANAPFTATVSAEWIRKLEDGGTITISNHRQVARDSSGRVFQERRLLVPGGDQKTSPISELDFSDPNQHELYICFPSAHTCSLRDYYVPADFHLPQPGELPSHQGNLTREDLGKNTLDGVEVVGTRETLTLNQGTIGNSQPLSVTKEFWYSPQLGINLLVKRVDPRHGTQIFSVSELKLVSTQPATFQPPQGYAIKDMRSPTDQQSEGSPVTLHNP